MRWLLIDAGNTALKWTLADAGGLRVPEGGLLAPVNGCGERLIAAVRAALPPGAPLQWAAGCSVAAEAAGAQIEAAVRQLVPDGIAWLTSQPRFEYAGIALANGYAEPERLGADRWHAMIAARQSFPGQPLLVVCAGTATTVDSIDADGRFTGGAIAPGATLMAQSLAAGTARLPRSIGRYAAMPDNTDDAIASGVADAQAGLVERRARHMARLGRRPYVVIAGGHGPELARHLRLDDQVEGLTVDEHLVLRGLWLRALQRHAGAGAQEPGRMR